MMAHSLIDVLYARSQENTKGHTFIDGDYHFLTYGQLFSRAVHLAQGLRNTGLPTFSPVLLMCSTDSNFIIAFWGILLAGYIPVPLAPVYRGLADNVEGDRFLNIFEKFDRPFVLCDFDLPLPQGHGTVRLVRILDLLSDRSIGAIAFERPDISESDVAMIQFSSGGTGQPKGVVLTHRHILTNARQVIDAISIGPQDSSFSWMPYCHDMGLIAFHLIFLIAGVNQYKMNTSYFVKYPLRWLHDVSRFKATIVSGTNFALDLILRQIQNKVNIDLDLSCIRLFFVGAEPISVKTLDDFITRLAPCQLKETAMFPVYGLSEATVAMCFPPLEERFGVFCRTNGPSANRIFRGIPGVAGYQQSHYVDLGSPLSGCTLEIRADDGTDLPDGSIGEIHLRGPNVLNEYFLSHDSPLLSDGFFPTGDVGALLDGRLCVIGRKKDIIFSYGRNYYACDVEHYLNRALPDVFSYVLIIGVRGPDAHNDKIIMFFDSKKHTTPSESVHFLQEAKGLVQTHFGFTVHEFIKAPRKEIPRTTSGKVMRFSIAEKYFEGCFDGKKYSAV